MKKLFMITLGGKAEGANIEVHDVQFIIAKNIEETENILRNHWYGIPLKLHIDSYKSLEVIDGYKISINDEVSQDANKLFFLHIGAYKRTLMEEIHRYGFLVRNTFEQAKNDAKNTLYGKDKEEHVDTCVNVMESPLLNALYTGFIHLEKTELKNNLFPDWQGYRRIDIL